MPHLVRKGKYAVKRSRVIKEHIRMNHRPRRVSPTALSLILIHINPALLKSLFYQCTVLLPHRGKCLIDNLFCLVKRDFHINTTYNRCIDIVHMQLINAQKLLPQGDIAVHLIHICVHGLNQIFVHGNRNLVIKQRLLHS